MLFDIPEMIFNIFIRRYKVKNIIDFTISWMDILLPAKYAILPKVGDITPTIVLFDLRSTELKGVRILILNNPPILDIYSQIEYEKLDMHLCAEVSEIEDPPSQMKFEIGNKAKLCFEINNLNMGIVHVTDDELLYLNLYSSQITNLAFETYLDKRYEWVKEYFKSADGKFLPISENCYLLN